MKAYLILVTIFLTSAYREKAYAVEASFFNYQALQALISQKMQLTQFPGNMQAAYYEFSNDKKSYSRIRELPLESQNTYRDSSPGASRPAPDRLQAYLRALEKIALHSSDTLQIRITDSEATQIFYDHKTILINQKDLERPDEDLKFIIAHEFSHFLLFSFQMESSAGLSPSGFTAIKLFDHLNSTKSVPLDYYLDHAETDVLACLLMKNLKVKISDNFLSEVLKKKDTLLNGQPLPPMIVDELIIRLKSLQICIAKD